MSFFYLIVEPLGSTLEPTTPSMKIYTKSPKIHKPPLQKCQIKLAPKKQNSPIKAYITALYHFCITFPGCTYTIADHREVYTN